MNYITQLKAERDYYKGALEEVNETISLFQAYLHGEKFIGTQTDGSRKDWIATSDLLNWLREVKSFTLTN